MAGVTAELGADLGRSSDHSWVASEAARLFGPRTKMGRCGGGQPAVDVVE